jgi:hypothetical protein
MDFYEEASLVMVPSGYKDQKVYSSVPDDGSGDLTFSRASNATRVGPDGLIEKVRTNLILQSEAFNTTWTDNAATVTPNTTANPLNGALTADTITLGAPQFLQTLTLLMVRPLQKQIVALDIATDYIATTTAAVSVGPVANVPRLDYLDSSSPRLLLEPQRTNLNTYSEDISQAQYGKNRCTVSANGVVSPDGYTNADKIVQDPSNTAWGGLTQVYSPTGPATLSVFAKKIDNDYIAILGHNINPTTAWFNLANGTVGTTEANVTSAKIEDYGNGWYRCSITATTVTRFNVLHASSDGGSTAPVNSETALWGFQLEASASYATSYIPTLGASVTRGADDCSKTGISSLIGQTEGTIFVDFIYDAANTANERLTISDGTSAKRIFMIINTSKLLSFTCTNAGSDQWSISTTLTVGQRYKIAGAYKSNDIVFYVNGVQIGTDTSASIPDCSNLYFANENGSTQEWNNLTNQLLLFPTRLSNDDLATLTTL